MYSSSLFQFYETRQRKLWKWWHIYKQHVILICWSALVAGNEQPLQTSMALSYGKIQRFKNTKVSITKVNIKVKITLGEPDWKPSLEHSESIRFPTFQRQTRVSIYSNDCKGSLLSHCFHCNSSKKKHFNVTFFPGFRTSWVTFSIFWHIAGLLLSPGRDSLQTVKIEIKMWSLDNFSEKIGIKMWSLDNFSVKIGIKMWSLDNFSVKIGIKMWSLVDFSAPWACSSRRHNHRWSPGGGTGCGTVAANSCKGKKVTLEWTIKTAGGKNSEEKIWGEKTLKRKSDKKKL